DVCRRPAGLRPSGGLYRQLTRSRDRQQSVHAGRRRRRCPRTVSNRVVRIRSNAFGRLERTAAKAAPRGCDPGAKFVRSINSPSRQFSSQGTRDFMKHLSTLLAACRDSVIFGLVAFLVSTTTAHAGPIISYDFTATVSKVTDGQNFKLNGAIPVGASVTGSFIYDAGVAGTPVNPRPSTVYLGAFLSNSVNIGGGLLL